jgi:hypothetical protein
VNAKALGRRDHVMTYLGIVDLSKLLGFTEARLKLVPRNTFGPPVHRICLWC